MAKSTSTELWSLIALYNFSPSLNEVKAFVNSVLLSGGKFFALNSVCVCPKTSAVLKMQSAKTIMWIAFFNFRYSKSCKNVSPGLSFFHWLFPNTGMLPDHFLRENITRPG